jgi:hypothetical protein
MMARPVTKIKPSTTPFFVAIVRIAIIRIAIVIVAMGIIIIAITIVIARTITIAIASITVATHGNASPQRKTYQKKNPKENRFLIHTIAPILSSL